MLAIPILLGASQLSTVAIELPDDAPAATVQKVVESCNQALGAPRCRAATPGESRTTLFAMVNWEGTELQIRLLQDGPSGIEVDRRHVVFSDQDAQHDRFIAAGLMVAALTAAQQTKQSETKQSEPEPPTSAPKPEASSAAPAAEPSRELTPTTLKVPLHLGMDLAAHLGQGLSGHPLRWGGGVRLWWVAHHPRLGAAAQASYLRTDDPTAIRWGSASLGLHTRLNHWSSLVGIELSAEAVAEHTRASAEFAGQRRTRQLWRFGARLSTLVVWEAPNWLQPYVGLQLTLLERGVDIILRGEPLGSEPEARLLGQVGLRVNPSW